MNFGELILGGLTAGPAAGLAIGSDLVSAYANHRENVMNRDFNADQANINRSFQERMSGSSHQREVADLQAAGLNPILSASRGASTPSGSSASSGGLPHHSFGSGVSTALTAALNRASIERQEAETSNIKAALPGILADNSAKSNQAELLRMQLKRGGVQERGWENFSDVLTKLFGKKSDEGVLSSFGSTIGVSAYDLFDKIKKWVTEPPSLKPMPPRSKSEKARAWEAAPLYINKK